MPALSARPCRRACAARTQFPEGGGSSVRLTDPVRDETGIPKRVTPGLEIFLFYHEHKHVRPDPPWVENMAGT